MHLGYDFLEEPDITIHALNILLQMRYFDQDVFSILSESSDTSTSQVSLRTKSRFIFEQVNESIQEEITDTEIYIPDRPSPLTLPDLYVFNNDQFGIPPIRQVIDILNSDEDVLDLTCYRFDEVNLYFICEALIGPPTSPIISLNLSKCPFGKDACITLSTFIEQSILQSLNLSNCLIGPEGIQILAEGIEAASDLVELNMSNCNLKDPGGIAISLALTFNETIKILDLSKNKLHTGAAIELGKMLKVNNCIEVLNLSWNDLYPENEAVKFLQGIRKNKTLQELNLSWNGFCDLSISNNLSRIIRRHKALLKLNLEYNCFRENGMTAIIMAIKKSKSLEEIYLGGNYWTNATIKLFITPPFKKIKILSYGEFFYMPSHIYNYYIQVKNANPNVEIIFKGKVLPNPPEPVSFAQIVLNRCKFLAMKPKKKSLKRDMGHFMLELLDNPKDMLTLTEFAEVLKKFKAKLDLDLIQHLTDCFTIKTTVGKRKKVKRVDIKEMANMYLTKHPTEPPPPPKPKKSRKSKSPKPKGDKPEKPK